VYLFACVRDVCQVDKSLWHVAPCCQSALGGTSHQDFIVIKSSSQSRNAYFNSETSILQWKSRTHFKMSVVCVIRAMQVVAQEQAAAAAAAAVKREAYKQRQVTKVLEASKLRSERATRVFKLKVQLMLFLCIQRYVRKQKCFCQSSQCVGVSHHARYAHVCCPSAHLPPALPFAHLQHQPLPFTLPLPVPLPYPYPAPAPAPASDPAPAPVPAPTIYPFPYPSPYPIPAFTYQEKFCLVAALNTVCFNAGWGVS